jgi:hypothetical protein
VFCLIFSGLLRNRHVMSDLSNFYRAIVLLLSGARLCDPFFLQFCLLPPPIPSEKTVLRFCGTRYVFSTPTANLTTHSAQSVRALKPSGGCGVRFAEGALRVRLRQIFRTTPPKRQSFDAERWLRGKICRRRIKSTPTANIPYHSAQTSEL